MNDEKRRPKVGIGVIVVRNGKVLIGKRKNLNLGFERWSFPGGHLELFETFEGCAARETMEETGAKIKNIKYLYTTNDRNVDEDNHYVTIFMIADYDSGEVTLTEPDKWYEWRWVAWHELPSPRFTPIENLLKEGINPFK